MLNRLRSVHGLRKCGSVQPLLNWWKRKLALELAEAEEVHSLTAGAEPVLL